MDPLPNLILVIIGSFLGVSLGLFLLTVKSVKNKANIFLSVYVLFISLYLVQAFLYRTDLMSVIPHLTHLRFFYEASAGALIYLYVRACTEKDFKMKPILWLHFLPLVIHFFNRLPYLLQTGDEKVQYYIDFYIEYKETPKPFNAVLTALLALVYMVLSIRLIQQYKKHLTNEASSIDNDYHRWLRLFASSALLPIVGIWTWAFIGGNSTGTLVNISFIFLFILSVYLVILFKPEIFHIFPNQIKVHGEKEVERNKYESSSLQDSKKERFIEKLVAYMESDKPYKVSDLTLSALAEQVNIPAHYLSQVINEKMKCPFLDFVNGYRVEEAKRLFKDEKYANYTIMAVAYEAGFNSKTAFYTGFKKHTGMTPSAFRKGKKSVSL